MKLMKTVSTLTLGAVAMIITGISSGQAQVPLSAYTDANGFIDVQILIYSLLRKHFRNMRIYCRLGTALIRSPGKEALHSRDEGQATRHEVILYCKATLT